MHGIPQALGCRALILILLVWQEEGAFWEECAASPPFFPPFISWVWWVPVFLGAWGLMAGLSGFTSHRCSLRLGGGSTMLSQTPNLHFTTQLLSSSSLLAVTVNLKGSTPWITLYFWKLESGPLLCWGFSFRTNFCLFYYYGCKSRKRLPHSHLTLITQDTLGHSALTSEF